MMILKLKSYDGKIVVEESMCTNPDCLCMNLFLTFNKVKNDDILEPLFKITLDTKTWEIAEKDIYKKGIDVAEITKEFMRDLNNETRAKMRDRIVIEKGLEEPIDWLDNMPLYNIPCIDYSEVFDTKMMNQIMFEYSGTDYFVIDSYCINPQCKCNDCILAFFDLIPGRKVSTEKFAIRLKLNTGKYKIENANVISNDEIDDIFCAFLENTDINSLLKKRYRKMKEFGRKRIKRRERNSKISKVKVGRNDPCPCGSGKKYKKCCGR